MNLSTMKEINIGGVNLRELYIGGVKVWQKGRLPSEYTELAYIEADGNQYIDTGVAASDYEDGIKYKFCGSVTEYLTASGNNYLFGCYQNGVRTGYPTFNTSANRPYVIAGATSFIVLDNTAIKLPSADEYFEFELNITCADLENCSALLNGEALLKTSAATASNNTAMPPYTIYLFGLNGAPSVTKYCGKLYSFIMKNASGELIRDYVPACRKSDSAVGLYDTVGDMFYENLGTGSFTAGDAAAE